MDSITSPSVVPTTFAVCQHGSVVSGDWTTRASAIRILESQARYAKAIGQSADGLTVIQGGYDGDTGDKLVRNVYPKRSAWRLL